MAQKNYLDGTLEEICYGGCIMKSYEPKYQICLSRSNLINDVIFTV